MATTDKVVSFENKMLVPRDKWQDNFLAYLRSEIEAVTGAVFFRGGVVEDSTILITSTVNDTFTLNITNASRVADGLGHVMDLGNLPSGDITDYPFENTNTATYYVGIRYQSVADTVEPNPRSPIPQYTLTEDTIGELGNPDSVTDNTTFIRLVVDGLLESSVDHSGRPVKVYLTTPVSPLPSVAFYSGAVAFTGGVNVIDIPYTGAQGPLGQTAPTYPISTVAADYQVHVQGPSWFKNTDLRTDPINYAFIGIITGNGPAAIPISFDVSDQNTVFILSLDRAYRAGTSTVPAPGRKIQVDSESVLFEQTAATEKEEDSWNAALRISKIGEKVDIGTALVNVQDWEPKTRTVLDLKSHAQADSGTPFLLRFELANLAGSTITLTRGSIDLLDPTVEDYNHIGSLYVEIEFSQSGNNGLYFVQAIGGTNTVTAYELDKTTAASFTTETNVNANFYILTHERAAAEDWLGSHTYLGGSSAVWNWSVKGKGLHVRKLGDELPLAQAAVNTYLELSHYDNLDTDSVFMRVFTGRIQMRGGGAGFNAVHAVHGEGDDGVVGWAQVQVDKVDTLGLASTHQPSESTIEWGFDYRGTDFGKATTTDDPGFQLAATNRIPWTDYNSGADNLRAAEAFTAFDADELTLTRAGADVSNMPTSANTNWILAEIEFDTPGDDDGVYVVSGSSTSTRVTLVTLDGSTPTFTASATGTVRFYGGGSFGPWKTTHGSQTGYVLTLVSPTRNTGALRLHHTSTSTTLQDFSLLATNSGGTLANAVFAIRGAGVFADRLNTKSPTVAWGASDSIITSLLQADSVDVDAGSSRHITLPSSATSTNMDAFERNGGGTWSVARILNRFDAPSYQNASNVITWSVDTGNPLTPDLHRTRTGASTTAVYYKPLTLPHNATLTSVEFRVIPVIGDGTANAMGFFIRRKQWDATTGAYLLSTGGGATRASGGAATTQTVTYTADQNNVIDNATYEYWIIIEKSNTGGTSDDQLIGIRLNYTASKLGRSLFDTV